MYTDTMSTAIYTDTVEYRLRDVPAESWRKFKAICALEDKSANQKLKELIDEAVEKSDRLK